MDSLEKLVAGYWSHHRLLTEDRAARLRAEAGDFGWACEEVEDAVTAGRPDVLLLLDALLAAPDADPYDVGAGPVEELLAPAFQ